MKKMIVASAFFVGALAPHAAEAGVVWGGNGHEYDVITAEGFSWTDARAAAVAMGPGWDLATITSGAEDAFVTSLLPISPPSRSHYWLGGTDAAAEGTFVWVTGEPFTYTNWWPGEPNNSGNEDFIAYDFRGGWAWNDVPDSIPDLVRGYLIERAVTVTPVSEPASLTLFGVGLAALAALRRRRPA